MKGTMLAAFVLALLPMAGKADNDAVVEDLDRPTLQNNANLLKEGRRIFRYDTFGDEVLWGDALELHLALAGTNNGGVGPGVSPATALAVGLKVDVEALPHSLQAKLRAIIVQEQEHEIDLSAALDIDVPLEKAPAGTNDGRGQVKKHHVSRNGRLA
jgi:hypothetical protein